MDDHTTEPNDGEPNPAAANTAAGSADESFGWTSDTSESGQGGPGATAERMLAQLQSMIDSIATQAAPVVRQVGAKAAELAAAAADKAGPIAHKAADATADASVKIAERSRTLAADLRRDVGGSSPADGSVLNGVDDAAEQAAKDDPAEGVR